MSKTTTKDNAANQVSQSAAILTRESFTITAAGLYSFEGRTIQIDNVAKDSGRKIHLFGTVDGESFKGSICDLKRLCGVEVKVYNVTGANPGTKVLTDQEISEKVAKFAGSLSNCLAGLAKVLNGVASFNVTFTDNENNAVNAEDLTTSYRAALLAANETAKAAEAERKAKKAAAEETKRRKTAAADVQSLMLQGKFSEAAALLAQMQA